MDKLTLTEQELLVRSAAAMGTRTGVSADGFLSIHPGWNPWEEKRHLLFLINDFQINVVWATRPKGVREVMVQFSEGGPCTTVNKNGNLTRAVMECIAKRYR